MSEIVLRDTSYSELPEIAHVMATAFWEDNLFGRIIHPHRNEHPSDVDLYWLRRARQLLGLPLEMARRRGQGQGRP